MLSHDYRGIKNMLEPLVTCIDLDGVQYVGAEQVALVESHSTGQTPGFFSGVSAPEILGKNQVWLFLLSVASSIESVTV